MSERSEREIRESIESTRARMGETIEQIGDRVNPGRVKADLKSRAREQVNEAKDNVKRKARNTMRDVEHGVSDTGRGIWATIRENPVPAGMVGVGVAWLIANRRSADEHRRHEYGTYSTGPAVPYRSGYTGSRYTETGRGSVGPLDATDEYGSGTEYGPTTGYGSTSAYGVAGSTPDYGSTSAYGAAGSTAGYGTTGGGLDRGSQDRIDARSTGFSAGAGSSQRNDETGREQSDGIRDKASNAMHQAGDRLEHVQERVGGAMHSAQDRVGGAMHSAQDRVSSVAHQAKERARRAEHRVEDSMRENPIAAGAAALAIGMAAGLMIPETDREHRVLGRARERVIDKAGDTVRRSAEKLHDAARDAAGETARHAVDEVWPGGDEGRTEGFSEPRR